MKSAILIWVHTGKFRYLCMSCVVVVWLYRGNFPVRVYYHSQALLTVLHSHAWVVMFL